MGRLVKLAILVVGFAFAMAMIMVMFTHKGHNGKATAAQLDTIETCEDGSHVEDVYIRLGTVFEDYGRMMQICSALTSPFEHIGCTAMSQDFDMPMLSCDLQRRRLTVLERHIATFLPQIEDACKQEPICLGFLGTLPMR